MAKTQSDLETRVLKLFKLVGEGQAASAEQQADAETAVETAHAELEEMEIAYWSLSAIPDALFEQVARYTAGVGAADMAPANEAAYYAAMGEAAERKLRKLTARGASGERMYSEYY